MSTNNNIPLVWDNEEDNTLLGSLFPNGFNQSNLIFNQSNFISQTPLSSSPLSKNGETVKNVFLTVLKYTNMEALRL